MSRGAPRLLVLVTTACSTAAGGEDAAVVPETAAEVASEVATDASSDGKTTPRNTCEWRYAGLTFEYVVECAAGDVCRLDVGVGRPDTKYRGVYCEKSTLPANCGDLHCAEPDWKCEDKLRGACVTTLPP